jgi:hypothetical protein
MTVVAHVAHVGKMSYVYKILLENLKGKDCLEGLNIDRRTISEKQSGNAWTGFFWLKTGTSGSPL